VAALAVAAQAVVLLEQPSSCFAAASTR